MSAYILRRILLMIPTIFGIMAVSFVLVQFAPGGPIERIVAQLQGTDVSATARIGGAGSGDFGQQSQMSGADSALNSKYRGAQGLDPEFIKSLEVQFGFDKPAHERFAKMIWDYARFLPISSRSRSASGRRSATAAASTHGRAVSSLSVMRCRDSCLRSF